MSKPEATATATEATEAKITPKKILVAIVNKFAESGVDLVALLGADIATTVQDFYDNLKVTKVRGLPAAERLALVEQAILDHYKAMPQVGTEPFGAWSYDSLKLLQRKQRIEREIAEGGAHPPTVASGEREGKRGKKSQE